MSQVERANVRRVESQISIKWAHDRVSEGWKNSARCAGEDPELWFPQREGERRSAKRVRYLTTVAQSFCIECPVRLECVTYAIVLDLRYGIWGGLTERERAKLTGRRVADG